ncbi:MAG TPA: NlpC/P60 family protein [Chthonomonadales bacterium]|nr:NlpC/P60 family protein [Chthonomonadales bacterium]
MTFHRLRSALVCVAAAVGALAASPAAASRTVVISPGDTLDSLARRFGVATRDIARANDLRDTNAILRDGVRLVIPDPPKPVIRPATMRQVSHVRGDRIAVRIGPHEGYRRVTLLDYGSRLTVTHRVGNWLQVEIPGGGRGWMREDFVAAGTAPRMVVASARRVVNERPTRRVNRVAAQPPRRSGRPTVARRSPRPEAPAPAAQTAVVRTAFAYRGVRYRFAGSSPRGFDCSGFTSYVYRRKGVSLPHNAAQQFRRGQRVQKSEMKPGDLVFFTTTRRGISHVGIYAGKGKFVHASSGGGRVRVDTLRSGYYNERFRGARRVK